MIIVVRKYLLVFLLFPLFPLWSQVGALSFRHINAIEDESIGHIISLHQDTEGILWIGSYNALYEYNGDTFIKHVPTESDSSISHPSVHAIYEDTSGYLWFGTTNGLNRFDKKNRIFKRFLHDPSVTDNINKHQIRTIHQDSKGVFWLGTYGGGFLKFFSKSGKFQQWQEDAISSDWRINCFLKASDGIYWIGTESHGVIKAHPDTGVINIFTKSKGEQENSISNNTITDIHEDARGALWIGTWGGGLNKLDRSTAYFTLMDLEDPKIVIKAIEEDKEGFLWLGSFGNGLIRFNPQTTNYQSFKSEKDNPEGLSDNLVWTLLYGKNEILWIGTHGSGLSYYDKYSNKFPSYKEPDSNQYSENINSQITAAAEGSNGLIWMGTAGAGIKSFDRNAETYKHYQFPEASSNQVKDILPGKGHYLWVGTSNGLFYFNTETGNYSHFLSERDDRITNREVKSIEEDKDGNLWVSVLNEGLFVLPDSNFNSDTPWRAGFRRYYYSDTITARISSNNIWDIAHNADGSTWIASDQGLDKIHTSGKIVHFGNYSFSCVLNTSPSHLWAGTFGRGLAKVEKSTGNITYYGQNEGLANTIVLGILQDGIFLWLNTGGGIAKFNTITNTFINYDQTDGLPDKFYNLNANIKLASGQLFLGGQTGFVLFHPEEIENNPYPVATVFTDVRLFNKSITLEHGGQSARLDKPLSAIDMIDFSYNDKVITFGFQGIIFGANDKVRYSYKLIGFDDDWVYTNGNNNTATYTNLEGGAYEFVVKAANSDGLWNENPTSLKISISSPFWETAWFRIFVGLVMLTGFYLWNNIRVSQLKRLHRLEQLRSERQLIKIKNEKLEDELKHKNSELINKTFALIHTNEKVGELKLKIQNILPKLSKTSKATLYPVLKYFEAELENDQYWDQFEAQMNLTHNNFLSRLKEAYPEINHNELRLCAYIRMNLSNHEIASLLNITLRGVESGRFRIRKKLGLDRSIPLSDFILKF